MGKQGCDQDLVQYEKGRTKEPKGEEEETASMDCRHLQNFT